MEWISSAGGPLVLVPKQMLHLWRGVAGGTERTDYDKACTVDDHIGLIQWNGCEVLVLGDEPFQAGIWTAGDRVTLVRWMYAPNEEAVIDCLRSSAWGRPVESMAWEANEASYILFDSGASGEGLAEGIVVEMGPDRYIVKTYVAKPSREVGLVLHVFEPRSE